MKRKVMLGYDFAFDIYIETPGGYRTGQYLFNQLPLHAADAVRGKLFDPFNKDLTLAEIILWVRDHIIFNEQKEIIGIYDGNNILWEREQ